MKQDEGRTKEELIAELDKLRSQAGKYTNSETQREKVVGDLKHHTELETLIMSISTNFINLEFDMIDEAIEQAIGSIGEFFQVGRSYIFLYSPDGATMSNTHEWCAQGISSQKHRLQQLPHNTFPWFYEQMQAFKTVYVPRVDDLGKQASALKEELTAEQITSMICVPMVCRNQLLGFVGFDSVRSERAFNDETKVSLRMLGEIFANAINRKQTGDSLRESERIYRTLVENVKFGVALIDKDHNIVMANEAMGRLFGKTVEEFTCRKCYNEFAQTNEACDRCPGAKSMQSGEPEVYEVSARKNDGSEFDMYIRAFPIIEEDGSVNGFIEVAEDITERKQVEKALRTSEASYRAIFDSASDAFFVHDIDTAAILDINQKACEIFGYTREEMLSLEIEDLSVGASPYTQEGAITKFTEATADQAGRFEWLCKNKKGRQFWVEVSLKKADISGVDRMLAVVRDISERKRGELALYMSEQRFRAIADYTYDWEIWCSPGGRPLWTNRAVERVSGYTVDECMGMFNFPEPVVYEDDKADMVSVFKSAAEGDSGNDLEFRLRRKDGSIIWASVSWQAIYDKKGISQGYRASIRDISARKQAQEAIQSMAEGTANATGEDFLRTLAKHLATVLKCKYVLIGELSPDVTDRVRTLVVWAKDKIEDNFEYDLAGTPCENVVGQEICFYPEKIRELFPDDLILAEMGAESYLGVPLLDSSGRGIGLVAAIDDKAMGHIPLTEPILKIYATRASAELERKKAGDALRESESRYRLLFEAANDAIFIMRKDKFVDCNERTLELFGCTREQIIGQPPYRFSPDAQPDGRDSTEKAMEKIGLALDGKSQFFEWKHCKYDGTGFDAEVSLNCLELGGEIFLQAMVRDITERKQAEEEVGRLLKTLAEKNEELESIVYVSSHDLRSPLVNIQGFSSELGMSCKNLFDLLSGIELPAEQIDTFQLLLNEQIPESINFINTSAKKMDMLLHGLMRLCRIGRGDLTIEHLNINSMIAETIDTMKYQIDSSGTVIDVGQLPKCDGDSVQIGQVFSNLIDNAMKYSSPDRKPEIQITGSIEGNMAVYCVKDNGIGISPKYQSIIFEIFHRLEPEKKGNGEGLGLTIVKRIVTRHGGNIRLTSELGKGSEFFVSLPVQTMSGG